MSKYRIGCLLLAGLVSAALAFNHFSFALASKRIHRFCEEFGGVRGKPIPEGSTIALRNLRSTSDQWRGCDSNCADFLEDPRNISILAPDWRDNPYSILWAPATGVAIPSPDPRRGGDFGPVGWYKFSSLNDASNVCTGRRIELYHQPMDPETGFMLDWERHEICRTPAKFSEADFILGYHALPEVKRMRRWWMPPIQYRNRAIVRADTHETVVSVTNIGMTGSWLTYLIANSLAFPNDSVFKGGCTQPRNLDTDPLIGRNARIFEGTHIQFE